MNQKKIKARNLKDDLLDIAQKLSRLGENIDTADFEERRRAVIALVKDIHVVPEKIDGKTIPIVTITYRFNEPNPLLPSPVSADVLAYTVMDSLPR